MSLHLSSLCCLLNRVVIDKTRTIMQGGRVHSAVYFTSPQRFIITFSYSLTLQLWRLSLNLIGCWVMKLIVQTFQPLTVIYRRCNFMYHYWGCKLINRPLSYPFRFLTILSNCSLVRRCL